MATEYEVVIVGGGIMGSATAYYLSEQFKLMRTGTAKPNKLLLLEQYELIHRKGSSHGGSRIFRRTYIEDHLAKLTAEALNLWRELENETQEEFIKMTGGLDLCKHDSPILKELVATCERNGIQYKALNPAQVNEKFPAFNLPAGHMALYTPESGIIRGDKALATFQSLAAQNGCEFRDNCVVTNIIPQCIAGDTKLKIVTSNGEEFVSQKCIIVAGAWTKTLLKKCFNLDVPLQPIQTTVAFWKVENPQLYTPGVFPVFNSYSQPQAYGIPLLEYPDLLKCCPYFGPECDPDNRDFKPDAELIEREAKLFIQNVLMGVSSSPAVTETCMYTETPDRDYIIDTVPSHPNVSFGCGFSGHGFKLAGIVGKMLAELAISGQHLYPEEQQHFALSRFSN